MAEAEQRVYLTIVYPPGDPDRYPDPGRRELAALLAGPLQTDQRSVEYSLHRDLPDIVGLVPRERAEAALEALRAAGGDGIAPSIADLEALGPTLEVRDLRLESEGMVLDLWRAETTAINPAWIDVVVRAHLSQEQGLPGWTQRPLQGGIPNWTPGGGFGISRVGVRMAQREYNDLVALDRQVRVAHQLDMHVRRPGGSVSVYQIDGDKFGFQILGDLRGHSDNVNIDRMCELVTHLSPQVIVDPYFALFRPPAAYERLRLPLMNVNQEDVGFAFYSRWMAMVYRHVGQA